QDQTWKEVEATSWANASSLRDFGRELSGSANAVAIQSELYRRPVSTIFCKAADDDCWLSIAAVWRCQTSYWSMRVFTTCSGVVAVSSGSGRSASIRAAIS